MTPRRMLVLALPPFALAVVVGLALALSAQSDMRALRGRARLASSLAPDLLRLARQEAAESCLDGLETPPAPPRLPLSLAAPDVLEEATGASGEWRMWRRSYVWKALPAKSAFEAVSALRQAPGWRIAELSMKALEDGSGASLSVVVETARRAAGEGEE